MEQATTDEARSGGGSEEKHGGQKVVKNSATGEHLLGPRDEPGRPTRKRQAPRRLHDYVRAVHATTIDRSLIVLENVEGDSKLTREPSYAPTQYGLSQNDHDCEPYKIWQNLRMQGECMNMLNRNAHGCLEI